MSKSFKSILIALFAISQVCALAATITSTSTGGDWSLGSSWVGGVVPTVADDVLIVSGAVVTVRSPYSSASPALCNSVTVDGTLIMGSGSGSVRRLDVTTFLIINNSGTLTSDGTATHQIRVGGDWTNNGIFNAVVNTGSTSVTFNGTGSQTIDGIASQTFRSFTINKTAGQTLTVSPNVTSLSVNSFTQTAGDFVAGATLNIAGTATLTAGTFTAGPTINISGNFTNNGTTFIANNGTVNFTGNVQTLGGSTPTTFHHLNLGTSNTTHDETATVNGNLTVANGGTFTIGAYSLTVIGTTVLDGAINITSITGSKVFGTLNIGSTGVWNNGIVSENVRFTGGINNMGTFTAGSGTYTFDTNAQTLSGSLAIPTMIITTVTVTNNNTLTVLTSLSGSGNFVQGAGAVLNLGGTMSSATGLDATSNQNTVNYAGLAQTVRNVNYQNLIFSGSGVKTFQTSTTNISGSLILSGAVSATTVVAMTIGSLDIGDGTSFTADGFSITVNGTTTIGGGTTGVFTISSTTGTKTFSGLVTINPGGIWNNTIGENAYFHNGITNNGTFTAGSGVNNFEVNSQELTGTFTMPNVTVATGVVLKNNGTLTVSTALSGAGTLEQGGAATLNLGGTYGITGLIATAGTNTVNYTGGPQNPKGVNYVNLGLSGSGPKNLSSQTNSISGNVTQSGTVTTSHATALVIGGNLNVGDGCTWTVNGFDLTVTGTTTIGNGTSGTIAFPSSTGTKIFQGLVTLGQDATWNNGTNNESITLRGGIISQGTFTAGTGTYTFDTNDQIMSGDFSIPKVTVTGIVLQVLSDLIISTSLSGTGSVEMGPAAYIEIIASATLSSISAPPYGSVVHYKNSAPVIIPGTYGNLILNQASGTASLSAEVRVNGGLHLNAGSLNIGNQVLVLGDTASIINPNPSASSMIMVGASGKVRKIFTGTGSFMFPIGENTTTVEYSPITVDLTSGSGFSNFTYLSVGLVNAKHPSNGSPTHFLKRYWTVSQTDLTSATVSVTGTYTNADINSSEGSIIAARLDGTLDAVTNGWKKTANPLSGNTLSITGAALSNSQPTAFTGITAANPTVAITGGNTTICTNGSTSLGSTVTGDGTITYAWSPATGLSATNIANPTATVASTMQYTLTIYDANGISATDNTTITTQSPTISASNISICLGTPGTLTATGASTYSWSPSTGLSATIGASVNANPSTTTVYTVTGTDANSCTNTKDVTVTVKELPTITVNSPTTCAGTGVSLIANGGTSYSWSPALGLSSSVGNPVTATISSSTNYTVTGTGINGCTNTAVASVIVASLPAKPTISGSNLGSEIPRLTSSSTTGNQWYKDAVIISGATAQNLDVTANGTYTVTVTSGSCTSVPSDGFAVVITGIEYTSGMMQVYPNPASDFLIVDWSGFAPNEVIEAKIVDMMGRVAMMQFVTKSDNKISVRTLNSGQHILLGIQKNKRSWVRFVKE